MIGVREIVIDRLGNANDSNFVVTLDRLVMDLIGSAILIQGVIFGTRQVYQQLEK